MLAGHGLRTGYYAQEHDTLDLDATVWENVRHASPDAPEQELRNLLGSFMFSGDQLSQPAGTLSGGEKTRLALAGLVSSTANVLLLDEPTNNLDPASREQVLDALRRFTGAVVLVTHDSGAVRGAGPGQGHRAARRHRGPVVRRITSNSYNWPDRTSIMAALTPDRTSAVGRFRSLDVGGWPTPPVIDSLSD